MQALVTENWDEYNLVATGDGLRLESFAGHLIARPDPNIIWPQDPAEKALWEKVEAQFVRKDEEWIFHNSALVSGWKMKWGQLRLQLKPTAFRHLGVFPEQAVHWQWLQGLVHSTQTPVKVLNLFAYTGASTIVAAQAGAHVTHVDASKGTVYWASENAQLSGVKEQVRWIVDDALKFMRREVKRGNHYDIILMDPPVFGRGPQGEIWRLHEGLAELFELSDQLFSAKPLGLLINFYATELYPFSVERLAYLYFHKKFPHLVLCSLHLKEEKSEKLLATGFSIRS